MTTITAFALAERIAVAEGNPEALHDLWVEVTLDRTLPADERRGACRRIEALLDGYVSRARAADNDTKPDDFDGRFIR